MCRKILSLLILAYCVPASLAQQGTDTTPTPAPDPAATSLQPQVVIETTLGTIVAELDAEKAPLTVMNFLDYADSGFYNDTIFHRVVKGRMIHGGGYTKDLALKEKGLREPVLYEGGNGLLHLRGTLGAYRRFDNLNSAQSQFFINTADNENLDKLKDNTSYAVFGKVIEGMDVVEKIEKAEVSTHPGLAAGLLPYVPKEPVIIKSIRVTKPVDRKKAQAIAQSNADAAADPVSFRQQQLENDCKSKAVQTRSGLRFIECKAGTGDFPLGPDTVEITYAATLANGFEFDNSKNLGPGPLALKVEDAIRGLREGLQMMREGGRMIFVIPPELGFGNEGVPAKVPPGATLFYDVQLESVKRK
jgi:peptidyl-prolyl cis-trans isomerase A (cyclophilin A)